MCSQSIVSDNKRLNQALELLSLKKNQQKFPQKTKKTPTSVHLSMQIPETRTLKKTRDWNINFYSNPMHKEIKINRSSI